MASLTAQENCRDGILLGRVLDDDRVARDRRVRGSILGNRNLGAGGWLCILQLGEDVTPPRSCRDLLEFQGGRNLEERLGSHFEAPPARLEGRVVPKVRIKANLEGPGSPPG